MTTLRRKNQKTALTAALIVIGMIALSFVSVPLYRLFCQVTGIGGTMQIGGKAPGKVSERMVTISFDTRVDAGLPWSFKADAKKLEVGIGQQGVTSFTGTNISARDTTGTALYNVTPEKVAKYFHKTQCFCFAEQALGPGKTAHFPVTFYVDPAILKDPEMSDVTDITLSYTFFATNSGALDKAMTQYGDQK